MNKKFSFTLLFLLFTNLQSNLQASLEHKDEFIDTYLANISSNMSEKTEILEHIEKHPYGTFIDIGAGGDSIAIIASKLNKNISPTLIAADIDPIVLYSIKKRRPEVQKFIDSVTGPKVELMVMSATKMDPIKNNSISGIAASALAHEVYSYIPPKESLDQFIEEVCRVLEKDGVFIYRDPKWVSDPTTQCIMTIKNDISKYYSTLFLSKFLDRSFSVHRDYKNECCKPSLYSDKDVHINAFYRKTQSYQQFSFKDFMNMPSCQIDYAKNFSIEAPKGLIAEIQRHYIMFLVNYFPAVTLNPSNFDSDLMLSNLTEEEKKILQNYSNKNDFHFIDGRIKKENFSHLFKEFEQLKKIFKEGVQIPISSNPDLAAYVQKLTQDNIDKNQFYINEKGMLVIDPKLLTLLFHGKDQCIFQYLNNSENIPWGLLEHLKLEGEEHYFYKTLDEVITYMGQISNFLLKNTHKKNYILAPIDSAHVKTAHREFYKKLLQRDMIVLNKHGIEQIPQTGKTIIHFQLMPKEKAIVAYKDILKNNTDPLPELVKWVTTLEKENSN